MNNGAPLTTPQVARQGHVSIRTVLRAVHDGELEAHQIGEGPNAPYIYQPAAVARWLNARGTSSRESGESDLPDPAANRVGQAHPHMNGTVAQTA